MKKMGISLTYNGKYCDVKIREADGDIEKYFRIVTSLESVKKLIRITYDSPVLSLSAWNKVINI